MKAYVESIAGSKATFEMVPIPGGTFKMGSPANERGHSADEAPQHEVTIRPFWMGKTEMTWEAFDLYAYDKNIPMGAGKGSTASTQPADADAITRPTSPYSDPTFGYGRKGHPIISISHHAAMEFCRWLSAKTGKTYRLPTEAEWEYACRAGTTTAFSFGPTPRTLSEYAWFEADAEYMPHAVGLKKPNPWGLYDMHGNVAEWCLDLYDKDFYKKFKPLIPAVEPVLIPNAEHYPRLEPAGPAAPAEHLVAYRRAECGLSGGPAARGVGRSQRSPVQSDPERRNVKRRQAFCPKSQHTRLAKTPIEEQIDFVGDCFRHSRRRGKCSHQKHPRIVGPRGVIS
jgi:formylglycine-generating enzyme required for sulfatase activity